MSRNKYNPANVAATVPIKDDLFEGEAPLNPGTNLRIDLRRANSGAGSNAYPKRSNSQRNDPDAAQWRQFAEYEKRSQHRSAYPGSPRRRNSDRGSVARSIHQSIRMRELFDNPLAGESRHSRNRDGHPLLLPRRLPTGQAPSHGEIDYMKKNKLYGWIYEIVGQPEFSRSKAEAIESRAWDGFKSFRAASYGYDLGGNWSISQVRRACADGKMSFTATSTPAIVVIQIPASNLWLMAALMDATFCEGWECIFRPLRWSDGSRVMDFVRVQGSMKNTREEMQTLFQEVNAM